MFISQSGLASHTPPVCFTPSVRCLCRVAGLYRVMRGARPY